MLDHVRNREVLGVHDNPEAFTPLSGDDIAAVRQGVALDRLAKAIGEAAIARDPSLKIEDYWLRYPDRREDFDLRQMANNFVKACTYYV